MKLRVLFAVLSVALLASSGCSVIAPLTGKPHGTRVVVPKNHNHRYYHADKDKRKKRTKKVYMY